MSVTRDQVGHEELVLHPRVQEALGELVGSAKEGLLALNRGVGLGLLAELLEDEVVEVVGPKGKHYPERSAVRHGHAAREATVAGRRVAGGEAAGAQRLHPTEVRLCTHEYFADRSRRFESMISMMLNVKRWRGGKMIER
jgi:putative transposase